LVETGSEVGRLLTRMITQGVCKKKKKKGSKGERKKENMKKGHISLYGSFVPNEKGENVRRK
jgi:hypothetical protein